MNCNISFFVCFFLWLFVRASKSLKSRQRKARHTVLNATIYKDQFIKWRLTIVLREILYVCPRVNLGALICLGLKLKKMIKTNMFIKFGVKYVLQTKTRYIAIKQWKALLRQLLNVSLMALISWLNTLSVNFYAFPLRVSCLWFSISGVFFLQFL